MIIIFSFCFPFLFRKAGCTYNVYNYYPIPSSSSLNDIVPDEGGFVNLIALDINSYADKYGSRAVRKNCTIPAWLNTFAEHDNINFSEVLRDSLILIYKQSCKE